MSRPASEAYVLVVDDDPAVREVTVGSLQSLGYSTLAAQDGHAALAVLAGSDRIDLLVVDVAMPGMNGIEVVQRAREHRAMRAIFVTGYAATYQAELGDDILLEKPYGIDRLAEAVKTALEHDPRPPGADHNVVALKPSSRR